MFEMHFEHPPAAGSVFVQPPYGPQYLQRSSHGRAQNCSRGIFRPPYTHCTSPRSLFISAGYDDFGQTLALDNGHHNSPEFISMHLPVIVIACEGNWETI